MATYQDIHRIIKETIQVDADPTKRWTPQLVKFINHENEFYGKFYGSVNASEFFASNCSLSNCSLSSCRLYDLSGNELDLNTLFPMMEDLNKRVSSMSVMVYETLPNADIWLGERIKDVSSYVDEVSSGISVLIDKKIKESEGRSSQGISAISTYLQNEIEQEWKDRYDNDKALSDDIADIRSKMVGGVTYRGLVHLDATTLSDLIWDCERDYDAELRHGFIYYANGNKTVIQGVSISGGDYIFINTKTLEPKYSSIKVRDIKPELIDVVDGMNHDVYTLISEISNDVCGLKVISADHETRITDERNNRIANVKELRENVALISSDVRGLKDISAYHEGRIGILESNTSIISSNLSSLSSYVDTIPSMIDSKISEKVQTLSTETVSADNKFIYSIREENGKIYAETRGIVDSDIEVDGISQNKIIDLTSDLFNISSELSTIDRRNRGDVSWMGDFTEYGVNTLSGFIHANTHKGHDQYLRKGFLYRFSQEHVLSDKTSHVKKFVDNDYLLVDNDVVISDATFESFKYIKDFQRQIDEELFHLSGNNTATGDNVFRGTTTFDNSVNFLSGFSVTTSCWMKKATAEDLKVSNRSDFLGQVHLSSHNLYLEDGGENGTLKSLSDDFQTQITSNKTDIQTLSGEVKGISCDNIIEKGYIISSLSQSEGKIDYGVTKLLSSHVEGLSDFVIQKIDEKIESLDVDVISAESGYLIDKVWQTDGKISAETRKIVSSDISYLSDYVRNEIDLSVKNISSSNKISETGYILTSLTQNNGVINAETGPILSGYVHGLSDYVMSEIEKHSEFVSGAYVHLSGNNSISGYNVFTEELSVSRLSAAFENIYDCGLDKFLSAKIKDLDDPKILQIVNRINEIIEYSGIAVVKIEDFERTICQDIKNKTIEIYQVTYPGKEEPEVKTFTDMKNILNGVLRVLKIKDTGLSLATRLKEIQDSIDKVQKYVSILNEDLSALCTHVNISCQCMRDDIGEISSNLDTLSTDYHTFKDTNFSKFDESKGIESMGLVVEDQSYNTTTGKHDKYVMTFLSGTIVFEKI